MTIRQMQIADYPLLYDLWLSVPGMGLNTLDDSEEGVARFLARNPETCFVAEENGQLIGCIMSGHDGRRGYIYHTCVHPDHRRKGIGRMLTDAALDALRGCRIHKVALVVFSDNTTGNAFWERMDFTTREDLVYRNRALSEMQKINT